MKKALAFLALVLSLAFLASCTLLPVNNASHTATAVSPTPSPATTPSPTGPYYYFPRAADGQFKTPEDAIGFFFDSLKKNDFLSATEAFGIYEIPDHFDYKAYTDRLKITYMPQSFLPEQYRDLNRAMLVGQAANCYRSAMLGLCGVDWQTVQAQKAEDDTTNFIAAISPDKLAGATLKTQDMESTLSGDLKDKHEKNMAGEAKVYGADACLTYVVELDLGNNKVSCDMMMLVKYGGSWKIASGFFTLAGVN